MIRSRRTGVEGGVSPTQQQVAARAWVVSTALALLLGGCTLDDSSPDPSAYRLSALSPNPVEAGGTLTLEGTLPEGTLSVKIAGVSHIPRRVAGQWQLTLSPQVWAGSQTLTLERPASGGAAALRLSSPLSVLPRITEAEIESGELRLGALGWRQGGVLLPGTSLELEGRTLALSAEGPTLVAALPSRLWGTLTLRLNVAGLQSAPYTLSYVAAGVRGKVLLPARARDFETWDADATLEGKAAGVASSDPGTVPVPRARMDAALRPTRFLVRATSGQREALHTLVQTLAGLQEATSLEPLEVLALHFADDASGQAAQRALLQRPELVKSLEADPEVRLEGVARGASALSAQAAPLGTQWFWPLLKVPDTWKKTQGEGVTVAVLDTGVLTGHPDLKLNLLPGYDFVDNDKDPQDRVGHGTHVAGLIAAKGQVFGAAPRAKVLPIRVLDYEGGDTAQVVRGLLYAAGLSSTPKNPTPAQIVNLSLGSSSYSETLAEAVRVVQQSGVLIVAATGNAAGPLAYPAALEGVLAVTAVSGPVTPYQPTYANRGSGTGLAAYGGDFSDRDGDGVQDTILSTDRTAGGTPGYGSRAGTSMAAPQVSGVAALALSSGIARNKLKETLERTALDLGNPGFDLNFGYGLVQAGFSGSGGKKVYVLALQGGVLVGWTLTDASGNYTLSNLPPETPLEIVSAGDSDSDGLLAEKGEWRSASEEVVLVGGQVRALADLRLSVSSGTPTYPLP